MRSILVTGSGGFVGRHLLARLAQDFPAANLIRPAFDLRDEHAVSESLQQNPPDACVHLAAIAAIQAATENPALAWQVNLHGSLALARAVLAHAPQAILLHVSTADAYGASFRGGEALTEGAVLAPMNTYAATKAAADLALGAMVGEGLRLIRVRPFNHTGPGQSSAFVVASFARQLARIVAGVQAPVMKVGDLAPARDFLDVRDVCRAYALILLHAEKIAPGTVFNIASGTPRRIGDILAEMMALSGADARIETEAARLRPSDIPRAAGDASALRNMLGWQPQIAWRQTLSDILADWRGRLAA